MRADQDYDNYVRRAFGRQEINAISREIIQARELQEMRRERMAEGQYDPYDQTMNQDLGQYNDQGPGEELSE